MAAHSMKARTFSGSMRGMPDSDLDVGEPIEREGRETRLPSGTRAGRSTTTYAASELTPHEIESASPPPAQIPSAIAASGTPAIEPGRRGARANDVVGGRYIVEGQLGRGGMGRVLRVRH